MLLVVSSATTAAMYKWVDDEGNVHYSQNPPVGRAAEAIKATPAPPASTSSSDSAPTTGEQQQEGTPPAQQPVPQMDPKVMKENCARARSNLETLTNHPRIRVPEGDSLRVIGEEERQAMIQDAKDQISEYCK